MNKNLLFSACVIVNLLLFLTFLLLRRYPPILILLHLASLIALIVILVDRRALKFLIKKKAEIILIVCFIILAFFVRMYQVENITPGMYGDELTVAVNSLSLVNEPEFLPFIGSYSHPTPLLYLTAGSIKTFGHSITAIRLPTIVFGALTVGAFYILLRLFFPVLIASAGAMLMVFQYTQIVLSRLAYEPIPSMFFQITAIIFLILYNRTKNNKYLFGNALSLGAGLYTYYNFRTFALLIFLLTLYIILRKNWRKDLKEAAFFSMLVFIAAMPLLSYAIIDPAGFWGRITTISVFAQHFSLSELIKELWGSIFRTAILPFYGNTPPPGTPPFSGDPNPGKNPSGVPMFDPITVILAVVGFGYLFIKKRSLFWMALLLSLPAFVSDVFSVERIPEGHYYGLGHPNALRVSGIIPIILFTTTAGIWGIYSRWGKEKKREMIALGTILIIVISIWNSQWYFGQKQNYLNFYVYNYNWNHGQELQMIKAINQLSANKINISKDLAGEYVNFFLDPSKKVSTFQLTATASAFETVKNADITAINVNDQTIPILNSMDSIQSMGYAIVVLKNPVENPETVIFIRTKFIH